MINTSPRKRVPAVIKHPCKTCGQDTVHAVGDPTYGYKQNTYRECTCLACGTKDPQVLIHAWRMVG